MFQKKLVRPFAYSSMVRNRQYSIPLQRIITDFSADESFENAAKKVLEHYGVEIQRSSARNVCMEHAHRITKQKKKLHKEYPQQNKPKYIIGEADGTMVPIVHIDKNRTDRRKKKTVAWHESRLSLAYAQGTIQPFYNATLGSTETAGKQLGACVKAVGQDKKTLIHCVGDGAPWIAEQVDRVFGSSATYLIDFYHLSGYIAQAALCCKPDAQKAWTDEMKACMKENKSHILLKKLEEHMAAASKEDHVCEASRCYNYIIKRTDQINYKGALDNNLPIGSGRIESGHRSVIQKRLKISGAWWTRNNAEAMLSLRTIRANRLWEAYWQQFTNNEARPSTI